MRTVTIGGASAMWGDSAIATPQLLSVPDLDYLVYDYLAETTMSILAGAREKSPGGGYAADFVTGVVAPHLETIAARGIRVVSNAGGLNPLACARAIETLASERGLVIRVAAITGDDVLNLAGEILGRDAHDASGPHLPETLLSANAYLGAPPIAAALAQGAQIVVTGRVVDSALVVAPLAYEHGWAWSDFDRLAQGTLAGHVIECGAQATGGLFTDWTEVPAWDDVGYPVLECASDAAFVVSKPAGTGGLVTTSTVAEQIVYEISDPARYEMPDVVCDLRRVRVEPAGEGRVRVLGARGQPPSSRLKVSATCRDGFQLDTMLAIRGIEAPAKARRTADALLKRTRRQMREAGFEDYRDALVELLGCESLYGPHARILPTREVVLRIAVSHREAAALEFLRREAPASGTSMGPGTRGHFGGRADIRPVVRHVPFFVDKDRVTPAVHLDGRVTPVAFAGPALDLRTEQDSVPAGLVPADLANDRDDTDGDLVDVPLVAVALARSGDKGDDCNIGVIARRPDLFAPLRAALTVDRVAAHFAHLLRDGWVERFELPGLGALNFVLHHALGGGGMASLRSDPLGKSFAQMLLDMEIAMPARLVADHPLAAGAADGGTR